jgi:hypothetical protein
VTEFSSDLLWVCQFHWHLKKKKLGYQFIDFLYCFSVFDFTDFSYFLPFALGLFCSSLSRFFEEEAENFDLRLAYFLMCAF